MATKNNIEQEKQDVEAKLAKWDALNALKADRRAKIASIPEMPDLPPSEIEQADDLTLLAKESTHKRARAAAQREYSEAADALRRFEIANGDRDALQIRLGVALAAIDREQHAAARVQTGDLARAVLDCLQALSSANAKLNAQEAERRKRWPDAKFDSLTLPHGITEPGAELPDHATLVAAMKAKLTLAGFADRLPPGDPLRQFKRENLGPRSAHWMGC